MSEFVRKKLLVTVKTYPAPARKGIEVSCTAGITEDGQWMRVYPMPHRFLGGDKQFSKYQWIELDVTKSLSDYRKESHNPNLDSINIVSGVENWEARKAIIQPLMSPSLCHLQNARTNTNQTLGIFKPESVHGVDIEKEDNPDWTEEELAKLTQVSFFERKPLVRLKKVPYKFYYRFNCSDRDCQGHRLSVVDWEIGSLYRNCIKRNGSSWKQPFLDKMETYIILHRDLHFYVGTIAAHPHTWIIIGLYYPPKEQIQMHMSTE